MKTIKGKNFILRPLRMSDAKSIVKHINDKDISRFMFRVPYPYKMQDAKKWLREIMPNYRKKNPEGLAFGIEIDGEICGAIGVHKIVKDHKAEIGYWLGKKYWGRGIMSEAVEKALKYCEREFGIKRMKAGTFLENKASIRVLKKNSFKYEGVARKAIKKGNKLFDAKIFARVK